MPFRDSDQRGGRILPKRSSVAGESPAASSLRPGELAANAADGVLYVGRLDGTAGVVPAGVGITRIVALSQAEYDAISVKSSTTLYVIS